MHFLGGLAAEAPDPLFLSSFDMRVLSTRTLESTFNDRHHEPNSDTYKTQQGKFIIS